jgi:hypothetical protein
LGFYVIAGGEAKIPAHLPIRSTRQRDITFPKVGAASDCGSWSLLPVRAHVHPLAAAFAAFDPALKRRDLDVNGIARDADHYLVPASLWQNAIK